MALLAAHSIQQGDHLSWSWYGKVRNDDDFSEALLQLRGYICILQVLSEIMLSLQGHT